MPFNISKAREEGVTDTDIIGYLSSKINFNVEKARKDGIPDSQIAEYMALKASSESDEEPIEEKKPSFLESLKSMPVITEPGTDMVPTRKGVATAGRAVTSQAPLAGMTAGGLVGATVGTTAGVPTGPGAVVTGAYGGVAGAGLGYGIGKKVEKVSNRFWDWVEGEPPKEEPKTIIQESIDSGADVITGAAYQAGGAVVNRLVFEPVMRGGKWAFRSVQSYFKKTATPGVKEQAATAWVANTSDGPIFAKNELEARTIEKNIPGLRFTYGQRTYDPKAIRMERSQFRKPGEGAELNAEQIVANDNAIAKYYENNFNATEGVDDFLSAVQARQGALETGVEAAKSISGKAQATITGRAKAPDLLTTNLQAAIRLEKSNVKTVVSKIYDQIPDDISVNSSGMIDKFKSIAAPTSAVESSKNFPQVLFNSIAKYGPKKVELPKQQAGFVPTQTPQLAEQELKIPFKELRGLRTEILNEARVESSKIGGGNPAKVRRLELMRQEVEEAIDSLGDSAQFGDDVSSIYRIASKAYREYHDIYKKGIIGEISRKGALGEASRMTPEQVMGSVFDKGNVKAADQLMQAIGETRAKETVTQYANYDLLRKATNPVTGEIDRNSLMKWVSQNRPVLKRYGIESKYTDITKAKQVVDEAIAQKTIFEKSQAAKVLGVDPENAIRTIFTGKGALNSGQTASDIMKLLEGNEAAQNGLKQAFADYAIKRVQTSMVDVAGNPTVSVPRFNKLYQELAPAMRVLYRDNPEKVSALLNIKRAHEIMLRNKTSPIGGGSDTYELTTQMLATLGGPMLTSRYSMVNAIRTAGRIFSKYQAEQIDKIINKALFNPEYAETLQWLGKGQRLEYAEKKLGDFINAAIMEESLKTKRN